MADDGEQPRGIAQAGGQAVKDVVSGFSGAPALLLIVILNMTMIVATAYYLSKQEEHRAATIDQVTSLLRLCFGRLPEPNHQEGNSL